jgi:hypothetical protein
LGLSSPEVDGRSERRKAFVVINARYGLRHLAVEAIRKLANALHVAGEGLPAQRPRDRKQICVRPGFFEHGLERFSERLGSRPAAGIAREALAKLA